MIKRDTLANYALAVIIALQSWILLEIVTMRDRITRVETRIERLDL